MPVSLLPDFTDRYNIAVLALNMFFDAGNYQGTFSNDGV